MTLTKKITRILFPLVSFWLFQSQAFGEKAADPPPKQAPPQAQKDVTPVVRESSVTINSKKIPYKSTAAKILLKDKKGKARASIFYVSYTRSDVDNPSKRPVMFAFNGGPGSSAVWLHLGILGPKRVDLPGDGTSPFHPPVGVVENAYSLLDVCDLVFVDPVSTGYSRAEDGTSEKEFHGIDSDIESVGDFVRLWITQNGRWASPKYLCGESYGGIRVAGLSQHLQSRYGMSLNGVILLSSLLDYRTLVSSHGSHLSDQVFLTAYTTTALYHGKISGDRKELIKQSRDFAYGEYGQALLMGNEITAEEMTRIATRLEKLTSISADIWEKNSLRISPDLFRAELLRKEGKTIGRFDSRVAWDSMSQASQSAAYDPSYSLAYGAFSTAMLTYLGNELGWKEDQPYEILTSSVFPWSYGVENRIVNMSDRLSTAMRDNPNLRVLVMIAHTDLATPGEGIMYSFRQMVNLPESLRKQVTFTEYEAGHMFYTNPPDLSKARSDLLEFLTPQ